MRGEKASTSQDYLLSMSLGTLVSTATLIAGVSLFAFKDDITTSPVPIPAAGLLFTSALALLLGIGVQRSRFAEIEFRRQSTRGPARAPPRTLQAPSP